MIEPYDATRDDFLTIDSESDANIEAAKAYDKYVADNLLEHSINFN